VTPVHCFKIVYWMPAQYDLDLLYPTSCWKPENRTGIIGNFPWFCFAGYPQQIASVQCSSLKFVEMQEWRELMPGIHQQAQIMLISKGKGDVSVSTEWGSKASAQQAKQTCELRTRSQWQKDVTWDLSHIGPSKHARLFATPSVFGWSGMRKCLLSAGPWWFWWEAI